jgi:hypothetical protein
MGSCQGGWQRSLWPERSAEWRRSPLRAGRSTPVSGAGGWSSSLGTSQSGKVNLQGAEGLMGAIDPIAGDRPGLFEVVSQAGGIALLSPRL